MSLSTAVSQSLVVMCFIEQYLFNESLPISWTKANWTVNDELKQLHSIKPTTCNISTALEHQRAYRMLQIRNWNKI